MAGFSGGPKVVAPGIGAEPKTSTSGLSTARVFMEDPLATSCSLEGSPLPGRSSSKIVRRIGEIYSLNTILDESRRLVHVTFGEVVAAHLAAVNFVQDSVRVRVPRRFSTVVTSAAGYPLDKTYYQTVKGMVTPLDILRPGGTLIVASACSEGFGSPEFRQSHARLVRVGPEAFLREILRKPLADVDEWQTEMQLKPMRLGRIQLYTTGLSPEDRAVTGVEMIGSVDQAVAESVARANDAEVAVIPEGPYVVPKFSGENRP